MENIKNEYGGSVPRGAWDYMSKSRKNRDLYGGVYLVIGAGKPCAAHASARDSPSTPRYLLRPSPVAFGAVRPDGSEIYKLPKLRASFLSSNFLIPLYSLLPPRNQSAMFDSTKNLIIRTPYASSRSSWLDSVESHAIYSPDYDANHAIWRMDLIKASAHNSFTCGIYYMTLIYLDAALM